MRDLTADPQRAEGPPVVWEGSANARAVVVLDPSGAAKHDELPATWRSLAERQQVVWCRTPASGSLADADEVLGRLTARDAVVDVVASGPIAENAMALVGQHRGHVRSLLLVDPGAEHEHVSSAGARSADAAWTRRVSRRWEDLDADGVRVRVVAHSEPTERDRIEPPLPLGHPDVVSAVADALEALESDPLAR
ncbi:MAG: hypothetical protein GEU98_14910 [Pseudonocardiaceae bacterium]|nr:hypothetical protein [Pseudonocardiaceae bacterium]